MYKLIARYLLSKTRRRAVGRSLALLLTVAILLFSTFFVGAADYLVAVPYGSTSTASRPDLGLACRSAVLMEASTGEILYAQNPEEAMPPASVTKIMTLLLVMEAMERGELAWDTPVTASAHAASMGGSQIYLEEGETMSARDMIKSVVIASANDAAVALAEHVAGSEQAFVARMNERAAELGMADTHFENTNGLDDTAQNHVTSAKDIAIMSRALIAYPAVLEFSSTWMDTIRDGAFGLSNTNRLVRFYRGCNGLKTGSTSKAGFCVSATAERDGMTLIAVIMGAESRDVRNAAATQLLDWGFATYALYTAPTQEIPPLYVAGGKTSHVGVRQDGFSAVLPKTDVPSVEVTVTLPESLSAPVLAGEAVGKVTYTARGKVIGEVSLLAADTSERVDLWWLLRNLLSRMFC